MTIAIRGPLRHTRVDAEGLEHRADDPEPLEPRVDVHQGVRMTTPMTATNPPTANATQRVMQHIASLRPVSFLFRHSFHHLDRWGLDLLGGRTVSSIVGGVPNILLTTTGAVTGRSRVVPLIGVPVDGGLAVIGTRWGSEHEPAWATNLRREPRATVQRGTETFRVRVRAIAEGPEYDAIMRRADALYVGFAKYRRRIHRRAIPIYVLEPTSPP
jgi:deazaflavin-dependent oxidoreductase (nitroreductase family)